MRNTEANVVLNALVGALGLKPTLAALDSGARLALANEDRWSPAARWCSEARVEIVPGRLRTLRARAVPARGEANEVADWC